MEEKQILLFDGVCNLCNGFVKFILKNELYKEVHFASLQSEIGVEQLKRFDLLYSDQIDSIVLIKKNVAYIKSDAIIEVSKILKSPYRYLSIFKFLPKKLRNSIYDFIAANRYWLFGKEESCWLPDKSLKHRFL